MKEKAINVLQCLKILHFVTCSYLCNVIILQKLLGNTMVDFKIDLLGMWSNNGTFEDFKTSEITEATSYRTTQEDGSDGEQEEAESGEEEEEEDVEEE